MGIGPKHRGAAGDLREFAQRFIRGRMDGFEKDMGICLTGIPSKTRDGNTHAYFPALMSCCGTFEYMTQLFLGRTEACSDKDTILYCREFMPKGYTEDVLRILHYAFRHPVAHRGIAQGCGWIKTGVNRNGESHGRSRKNKRTPLSKSLHAQA